MGGAGPLWRVEAEGRWGRRAAQKEGRLGGAERRRRGRLRGRRAHGFLMMVADLFGGGGLVFDLMRAWCGR